MDRIVKDSSIWIDESAQRLMYTKDTAVRIGMVKEVKTVGKLNERAYVVEVFERGNYMPVMCTQLVKFGGIYNYEEFSDRGYEPNRTDTARGVYAVSPGDTVLVVYVNGDSREGVIIGSLRHEGRKPVIGPKDGIAYVSEFNGINTQINNDGEYTFTFKGQPKNIAKLNDPVSGKPIPAPDYDKEVGTTYYKFDKTGGWTISDNATKDPQSIKTDKKSGKIIVTSGKIVLTMDKNSETTSLQTKNTTITSTEKITGKTKQWEMDATTHTKIRSPKIAIGSGGVELLDKITKLVDMLGNLTIISPVGPCALMKASPQWGQVEEVKAAINSIKGSL